MICATTVAAALTFATQTHAIQWLFDEVGDNFTASYNLIVDDATLDADITATLSSLSNTSATFDIFIDNTNTSGPGDNRITSWGVDVVAPELSGVTTSTADWGATLDTTFPNFQQVDLCAWDGNNCAGGTNEGVFEGNTESFQLFLTTVGDFTASGITFDSPFPTKWQSVGTNEDSYEFDTTSSSTSGGASTTSGGASTSGGQVSEPGVLLLLGIGLLGQAFILMRRRRLGL